MKTALIHGYYGCKNFGDEAILKGVCKVLREIGFKEIFATSGDVEYSKRLHGDIEFVQRTDYDTIAKLACAVDFVGLGGGGLFQEHYRFDIPFFFDSPKDGIHSYMNVPLIGRIYGKPIAYLFQGVGPLFSAQAKRLTRFAFSLADHISVRDSESARILKSLGIDGVVLSSDPVFAYEVLFEKRVSYKPKLGISLRFWVDKEQEGKVTKIFSQFLNKLKDDYEILLFSFHDFDELQNDTRVLNEIRRLSGAEFKIVKFSETDIEGFERQIAELDFLIGMRLHSSILAIKYGIPFVAINYSDKVKWFLSDINLADFCLSFDELSLETLDSKFDLLVKNKDVLKGRLDLAKKECKASLHISINALADFIQKGLFTRTINYQLDTLMQEEIKNLSYKVIEKEKELRETKQELERKEREFTQAMAELTKREIELRETREELERIRYELSMIYSSDFWKLASLYYRMVEKYGILRWMRNRLKPLKRLALWVLRKKAYWSGEKAEALKARDSSTPEWVNRINVSEKVAIVTSVVEFQELTNQRPLNFAKELSKVGYMVLFVVWQWDKSHIIPDSGKEIIKGIIQVGMYEFFNFVNQINERKDENSFYLITFPASQFVKFLPYLRKKAFSIIYDIMDDWEDFYKRDVAPWYDKDVEENLILQADYVCAVSPFLVNKFSYLREDTDLIPNGYSPEIIGIENKGCAGKEASGQKIVGYYGWLSDARFNWSLLFKIAERMSDVKFEIIGYGEPSWVVSRIKNSKNINFIGKVLPRELHKHVKKWNAGFIPFHESDISRRADLLKIYEFIFFGLPTVVTGVETAKDYPLMVFAMQNEAEKKLREILNGNGDYKPFDEEFLKKTTWSSRVSVFLEKIKQNRGFAKLYA